jgi:hypothetical protein
MRERSGDAPGAAPRRAQWGPALGLLGLSTAATLLALELLLRIVAGDLLGRPDPGGAIRMVGSRYPGSHHPQLGWVPTPGEHAHNAWGTRVTISEGGTRAHGAAPLPGDPVIAVGDSFTFGDEVDDADTWPAQLEALLAAPVVNGGVFGYGLDQIVLRAEQLLARGRAAALVVSIVPNDVLRCEYAYRYAWKPYFIVQDGELALAGVPVPEPGRGPPQEPAPRRWLRWSFLADLVYRRLDPEDWLLPDSLRVHRRGVEVGSLLIERLDALSRQQGIPWLFVLNWYPRAHPAPAAPLVARARSLGVELLEMQPLVEAELASGRARIADLYRIHAKEGAPLEVGHMTRRGNALVAAAVAERLRAWDVGRLGSAAPSS